MTRTLLLFSGGVESTSLLKYLTEETNDEVVACFISLQNQENHSEQEANAISKILPRLVRPVTFSSSFISLDSGKGFPPDHFLLFPIAVSLKNHHKCDRILRGTCFEDGVRGQSGKFAQEVFYEKAAITSGFCDYKRVFPFLPQYTWPKKKHMEYLGDLLPLTWSCRTPKNGSPCGTCHSCRERNS